MQTKPFSVRTLSERWDCSPGFIYKRLKAGELRAFRIGGQLLRIPAEEVNRWEGASAQPNQNTDPTMSATTGSDGSGADFAPLGTTMESGGAISLALRAKRKRERSFMRLRERT
jgi:excisionase family DNA binding protein